MTIVLALAAVAPCGLRVVATLSLSSQNQHVRDLKVRSIFMQRDEHQTETETPPQRQGDGDGGDHHESGGDGDDKHHQPKPPPDIDKGRKYA
jgi:hypothetical protein